MVLVRWYGIKHTMGTSNLRRFTMAFCNNPSYPFAATHRASVGCRQCNSRARWLLSIGLPYQTTAAAFAVARGTPAVQHVQSAGRPQRKAGSAEWPTTRLPPACSHGRTAASQQICTRIQFCTVSRPQRGCAAGALLAVIRSWLETASTNKGK